MRHFPRAFISASAMLLGLTMSACAQMPTPVSGGSPSMVHFHPNSIQPETTLDINAEASVKRAPDIAYITAGVQEEAPTAKAAMAQQAKAMTGVFDALSSAGVAKKDMQTSNLSLQPVYDYIEIAQKDGSRRGEQQLRGYIASNQLTVKVRDLENVGATLDSLVSAGSNTLSGISFALDDASEAQDEARSKAMKDALARAKLFADAAGLRVSRIVSISESGGSSPQPMQMSRMAMMDSAEMATPIAGGEVGFTARVSVTFELMK